jgi:hypothetical protein
MILCALAKRSDKPSRTLWYYELLPHGTSERGENDGGDYAHDGPRGFPIGKAALTTIPASRGRK